MRFLKSMNNQPYKKLKQTDDSLPNDDEDNSSPEILQTNVSLLYESFVF